DVAVITVVDYAVHEVSFYDEDLNLVKVETVNGGEVINPSELASSNVWYPVNSDEAAEEAYVVDSDLAFFAVSSVKEINSVSDLKNISNDLDGRYVLGDSLDLSGINWEPIGTKSKPFTGRLNGKAKSIKGLTINRSSSDYVGLFGYAQGANIIALRLNINTVEGHDYVGALVGHAARSTVTAVSVTGDKVVGTNYVAGIVGDLNIGTITATFSTVDVEATGDYVAGVVGDLDLGTVTATFSKGDITTTGDYVGGVVGHSTLSTVTAAFVYGRIHGGDYVGGVVGRLRLGTVVATFLHGRAYGDSRVDGIVGGNLFGISVLNFADGLGFLAF
ncbi:MAG: hypothetical protein LBC08_04095, partial [Campylobacteraceae bacterium]|nr:hypothetical protein [Campylobacteraceae bacterium]